jgi:mRNA-degrading endonuclease toxin of MazEF toxin-antitoxin module
MNAWDVFECDLGHGPHPVVIVSHPLRAANKPVVEVLDCSSQRAARAPAENEVLLDNADGMDWPTFCKCDLIYAVPKTELLRQRGSVHPERRKQIISTLIRSHGWTWL